MIKKVGFVLLSLFSSLSVLATHNRGGEITYTHISGLTYRFTITTCTDIGSSTTDRDELYLDFDLGTPYAQRDTLQRDTETPMPFDHKKNVYTGIHTFTSSGTHRITMEDPNRNLGIENIYTQSGGSSDDIVFALEAYLIIDPTQGAAGANNSPQFDDCPCPAIACVNKPYCYNPLAYDLDDDSLSYELVAPLGLDAVPLVMPSIYMFPDDVGGGNLTINEETGTVCWNNPMMQGEFNFTIKITEWRNGVSIGSVLRDVQLTVKANCTNDPPQILSIQDTCIVAGESLTFSVEGSDVNFDNLDMVASGLSFNVQSSPSTFNAVTSQGIANGVFQWQTNCSHIKSGEYLVLIGLTDDGDPSFSDYESFSINVIPPPLTGLVSSAFGNGVNLSWNISGCSNADGYNIYRGVMPNLPFPNCCAPFSVQDYGFTLVDQVLGNTNNTYFDDNGLNLGIDYCYVVTAIYDYGQVESCPSDTSCVRLLKDVPVVTNVSVFDTDVVNGSDSIIWSKPTDLDTLQYPGPYHYKIYRGSTFSNTSIFIGQTSSSALLSLTDTIFVNNSVNTVSGPNFYRVELFYTNNGVDSLVGTSNAAGSIFVQAAPNDNEIALTWIEQVPWINTAYNVFRVNPSGPDDFIGQTTNQFYVDSGLVNGTEYCYYVISIGEYTDSSINNPLLNVSQQICATPIDLTPPCPPELSLSGDCDIGENTVFWTNPNNDCSDDVMSYNLYFKPVDTLEYSLLATFSSSADTSFVHTHLWNDLIPSIAGCYKVTAVDSVQYSNESIFSNEFCVDNCPDYWFPNVFTPNADGDNDYFLAMTPFSYIESIDIKIYNRWGIVVYESKDPFFQWNGNTFDGDQPVPSGVYFYNCTVNTIRLSGIQPVIINGYLHLFRDGGQLRN